MRVITARIFFFITLLKMDIILREKKGGHGIIDDEMFTCMNDDLGISFWKKKKTFLHSWLVG